MNFAEKKQAYHQLQGQEYLEADKELLLKKSPKSPALRVGVINREKAQCEIVWALLDVASMEEIIANRPAPVKKLTIEEMKDITAETGKLAAHIHKVKTLEEKAEIIAHIKELIKDFPEDMAAVMLKLPESIVPDFVKTAEFIEKLLAVDFLTVKQPELANIARGLKIEAPDYKLATLRPIMEEYRLNLPKVSESHSDQVIDQMNAEKEELEGKVEELESENEDLQEQLEETEAALEETTAELEEEKKSESKADPV
jgi:vacuolar-type H+-ATPase subunit I/STV1